MQACVMRAMSSGLINRTECIQIHYNIRLNVCVCILVMPEHTTNSLTNSGLKENIRTFMAFSSTGFCLFYSDTNDVKCTVLYSQTELI